MVHERSTWGSWIEPALDAGPELVQLTPQRVYADPELSRRSLFVELTFIESGLYEHALVYFKVLLQRFPGVVLWIHIGWRRTHGP